MFAEQRQSSGTQQRWIGKRPPEIRQMSMKPMLDVQRAACACDGGCPRCAKASPAPESSDQTRSLVNDVVRSPGTALDSGTRALMEGHFGGDLGGVRIHTDSRAAESSRAINARAYTAGS